MQSDAVLEAEWRAANRAALKCEEIAQIYRQHGGAGATIAITALEAAASAIRKMADESLKSSVPLENGRG
jgi:hypothetical protein